ncbi:MAG: parvulin peptidyl-prolyl isomerase [Ignavibacteria bacterium]|nr:parvulin peptidyl-prolyl isomerase [Ignavibacteria bacterium]
MKKILFVLFLSASIYSQEILDKVVAIVDNEIILQSDLTGQVAYVAAQRRLDPNNAELKEQILNAMIEEKLLYAQAERDTIEVSNEQIDQQLDYQLNFFIQQYGSREKVEEVYGMSIEKIKRELRDDVRKNLMAQTVQNMKFGNLQVTKREIEEFYETYKDSLGQIPERFHIYHIFVNPTANAELKNKARDLAQSIIDSIKNGADFAEMAKKYSEDPGSAAQGGDLGFVKRGSFYPEFEAAAYSLRNNEISAVTESPVGFHIIQTLEKRGQTIHSRHILIKIKPDEDSDLNAITKLNGIRDSVLKNDKPFSYFAQKYSDDKQTNFLGGELGTFELSQLDKNLFEIVSKMKKGEVSYPKRLQVDNLTYGFHIVKLADRIPAHKPTLENDYEELKKLTEFSAKQKLYKEWIKEIKENIYWEIKE